MIVPTPIAAIPSTSAWCIFTTSAVRPRVGLSTTRISHSGRERSSRSDIASPTTRHSSASPPGSGHGTVAHVPRDVEVGVVLPDRVDQAAGRALDEPHPVVRDQVDSLLDPAHHGRVGHAAAQHQHAADVHVDGPLLGLDGRQVGGGEGERSAQRSARGSAAAPAARGGAERRGPTTAR